MPPLKQVSHYLLCHPNAPDLAWGPRGWTSLKTATVFSGAGKEMFKARRAVRGRWLSYPEVLTTPPVRIGIDFTRPAPLDSEHNIHDPTGRAVTRERNRLAREARAKALREADPLPTGVKHNDVP